MTAWYEFEEIVGRVWHRWASDAASYPRHPQAAVPLAAIRDALAVYFRAAGGGTGLTLSAASMRSSQHRLTLRQRLGLADEPIEHARRDSDHLVLPGHIDVFDDPVLNRDTYFWLVAFLAEARAVPSVANPILDDLMQLAEVRRTACTVCQQMPGLALRYARLCRQLLAIRPQRRLPPVEATVEAIIVELLTPERPLRSEVEMLLNTVATNGSSLAGPLVSKGYRPPLPVPLWGRVLGAGCGANRDIVPDEKPADGRAAEADGGQKPAERRYLDQAECDDPLLLNPFEKMLSWAEMVNVNRHVEDDEEEDARRAVQELEHLTLSRHRKPVSTRLKIELDLAPGEADEAPVEAALSYPEWHYRKRCYLQDYCQVVELQPDTVDSEWQPTPDTRRRIRRVRRQFEALRPQREHLRAQIDGDDFDLDALIRSQAEQRAGEPGSDRIYASTRQQIRDLAVSVLIDTSLSTDAMVGERRVLDLETEALMVLAHGIEVCGDALSLAGFTSRRRQVRMTCLKEFDEPMGPVIEHRIAALRPGLYTRMGAAIRRVSGELAQRTNRHRLLLVLTDGKPNDTDHYEGRYGLEDTRMAIREARRLGLTVFGVTVDTEARQYFPLLFGRSGYAIVTHPESLTTALPTIYRQVAGR